MALRLSETSCHTLGNGAGIMWTIGTPIKEKGGKERERERGGGGGKERMQLI